MYSQDPGVKRRRLQMRFFAYGIMTIATVALATIGIFYVLGYRLDNSFELERGGLVKLDSRPQEADITIDGEAIDQTPYQINVAAGEHMVTYAREGYQGWQKTVEVRAGEVLWLNYARLIPTSITTGVLERLSAVHDTSTSPDRESYVVHETAASPEFSLVDVRDETDIQIEPLSIPASAYAAAPDTEHTFDIIAWDVDSDYMLVRHRAGDVTEYLRVPRDNPAETINISRLFELDLKSVQFASNTAGVVFATDVDDALYRLDLNNKSELVTVAEEVSAFDNLDESRVAFVNPSTDEQEKGRSLNIWRQDGDRTVKIRPVPASVPVKLSYEPFLTSDYVSLVADNTISVIEDPLSDTKKVTVSDSLDFSPAALQPSPGSRFFMAQRGEQVYVYDIELRRSYSFIAANPGQTPLQWADDHHLALVGNNNLRLVEFDGTNMQYITSVFGAYDIIIGAEGEALLSIGEASGEPVLQRSLLLTEEDR